MRAALVAALSLVACAGSSSPTTTDAGSTSDAADSGTVADSGTAAVCTVRQDQTCNDSRLASSLWGECQSNGTCHCHDGFEVNAGSGKCRPIGSYTCGDTFCGPDSFCVERVHARDGGSFSEWMCMSYFQCTTTDCRCALQNFVSASCVDPTCQHEGPEVALRCDDLN